MGVVMAGPVLPEAVLPEAALRGLAPPGGPLPPAGPELTAQEERLGAERQAFVVLMRTILELVRMGV